MSTKNIVHTHSAFRQAHQKLPTPYNPFLKNYTPHSGIIRQEKRKKLISNTLLNAHPHPRKVSGIIGIAQVQFPVR